MSEHRHTRPPDLLCVLVLFVLTLAVYAPALFGGKVLLPADIVPLMRPWAVTAREKFPDLRFTQNQMHGPIFEYYSWRHYARERILQGEVPLWNPYELGGNVLLGNSQSAVLYPPNILLYLCSLPVGINLVTALHTFLTGLFLFGLLRSLGLRSVSALTGALVWMFCGLQIVWTEFQTPTAALCWLPAALWAWERYAQTGQWRWAVAGSGSAIALTLLAGHLQFAFYVILAFVLYAVWRSWVQVFRRSGVQVMVVLAASLGLGVLLSMATMLPVLEIGRMNFRAGKTEYASSIGLRLPPQNLFTLVVPNLFGNPRDYITFDADGHPTAGHPYIGPFDFIEYTAYMGIPALILALIGAGYWLSSRKRQPDSSLSAIHPSSFILHPFFLALALLGLLLALGTSVCALLFYGVPGYRQFNATARALCLFSFATAALAAYGVEALAASAEHKDTGQAPGAAGRIGHIAGWAIGGVLLAGLAAFPGMGLVDKRLLSDAWLTYALFGLRHFVLFLALTGLCVWLILRKGPRPYSALLWLLPVLAVGDLLVWGAGFDPMTDPAMLGYPTTTTDFLGNKSPDRVVSLEAQGGGIKSFIVPNYNAVVHLREVQGADSLHTKRYHQLLEKVVLAMDPGRVAAFMDPNTLHVPAVSHPLFDLLNVRYVTTAPDQPAAPPLQHVEDAELTIWENPRRLGPAWVVGAAERVHGLDDFLARLGAPNFDARKTALLESDAPPLDAAAGTAVVTAFAPHRIDLDVESGGRGLLVLSEIAFPGWRATVDGQPARILTTDWILRAVPVSPGRHHVVLTYEPTSYRLGLYLSVLAAGVLGLILACRNRGRKPTYRVPPARG